MTILQLIRITNKWDEMDNLGLAFKCNNSLALKFSASVNYFRHPGTKMW